MGWRSLWLRQTQSSKKIRKVRKLTEQTGEFYASIGVKCYSSFILFATLLLVLLWLLKEFDDGGSHGFCQFYELARLFLLNCPLVGHIFQHSSTAYHFLMLSMPTTCKRDYFPSISRLSLFFYHSS